MPGLFRRRRGFAWLWRLFPRACFATLSTQLRAGPNRPFLAGALLLWSPPSHGIVMIGIVLVTHGRLAQEFIAAMEHMVGPQTHLRAVCIGPEDDIERRQREIAAAAKSIDAGQGVVIATDMFGGTP